MKCSLLLGLFQGFFIKEKKKEREKKMWTVAEEAKRSIDSYNLFLFQTLLLNFVIPLTSFVRMSDLVFSYQ